MNNKALYFLHIPKTAGKFISANIKKSLNDDSLSYISTHYPNNKNFLKNKIYISAHAGTFVLDEVEDLDVATILRNPIEARSSYFTFIYPLYLKEREEYKSIKDVKEKFVYYLFQDKNFLIHNNYQSRFICNPADKDSWDLKKFFENSGPKLMKKYFDGQGFDWFVNNSNTSIENAKEQVDSFKIVNTIDNINLFCDNIKKWFLENHNKQIKFNFNDKVNVTTYNFDNQISSHFDLIKSLNVEEINKFNDLNKIDIEIYNYIKNKEGQ